MHFNKERVLTRRTSRWCSSCGAADVCGNWLPRRRFSRCAISSGVRCWTGS